MRRTLSILLVLALMLSTVTSAFAVDGIEGGEQPQESEQQTTVTVSSLEELETAIAAAEDGDTIAISKSIKLNNVSLVTDKDITLVPADNSISMLFSMGKDSELSGFTILTNILAIYIENTQDGEIVIENCKFIGNANDYNNFMNIFAGNVRIADSSFENGKDIAINISFSSVVTVERCSFVGNTTIMQGAGIHNMGECYVEDSSFTNNTAGVGGGIYNSGTMEIIGCTYSGNKSTDTIGQDIVSEGTLSITDDPQDGAGYYEESTGEKVSLPLADFANTAKLIWLTNEQAAEYFAPVEPDEPEEQEPSPDDTDDGGEATDTPVTPPNQPEQPENGDGDNLPSEDEDPPTTPETPQDKPDDDEDDHEPTIIYRPVYIYVPVEPEPEESEPVEPSFVCGDAVIDVSRSVVLEGYTDGLLHLEDGLTRAQFMTILYRLLDEDTLDRYESTDTVFADVAPDAWYCRYVSTIANAGIVCGTGDGNFDPEGILTWGHIITILSRFVETQEYQLQNINYDGWAADAVETAVALGWIMDHAAFNPDAPITRGELAYFVNYVLGLYR